MDEDSEDPSLLTQDQLQAIRRIKYKYAREYIEEEEPTHDSLRQQVDRIIEEEMSEEEVQLLRQDLSQELKSIKRYHKEKGLIS